MIIYIVYNNPTHIICTYLNHEATILLKSLSHCCILLTKHVVSSVKAAAYMVKKVITCTLQMPSGYSMLYCLELWPGHLFLSSDF